MLITMLKLTNPNKNLFSMNAVPYLAVMLKLELEQVQALQCGSWLTTILKEYTNEFRGI